MTLRGVAAIKSVMSDSLSARLRALRDVAGITQREADRLAGVHRGHVWQIEEGGRTNPTVQTLSAFAALFGVSLDWLAVGRGDAPSADAVRAAVELARGQRSEVA